MCPKKTRWQFHTVQDVPMVEKGASPFVVLKLASLYNGEKFIEDLEDLTVTFQLESCAQNTQKILEYIYTRFMHQL